MFCPEPLGLGNDIGVARRSLFLAELEASLPEPGFQMEAVESVELRGDLRTSLSPRLPVALLPLSSLSTLLRHLQHETLVSVDDGVDNPMNDPGGRRVREASVVSWDGPLGVLCRFLKTWASFDSSALGRSLKFPRATWGPRAQAAQAAQAARRSASLVDATRAGPKGNQGIPGVEVWHVSSATGKQYSTPPTKSSSLPQISALTGLVLQSHAVAGIGTIPAPAASVLTLPLSRPLQAKQPERTQPNATPLAAVGGTRRHRQSHKQSRHRQRKERETYFRAL